MSASPIINSGKLSFPFQTLDPFLFAVFHADEYPAGTADMRTIDGRSGNGQDFGPTVWSTNDPSQPKYRFYHGTSRPGFPSHPHYGMETLTCMIAGTVDHADSLGNGARYGGNVTPIDNAGGDLQWMTAGSGVQHSEAFPLLRTDAENPTKFFQLWLNLPNKKVDPYFVMHWGEDVQAKKLDSGAVVTVWAGDLFGLQGQQPPPDSWARDAANDVAVVYMYLPPGATVTLPAAKTGAAVNRRVYFFLGDTLAVGEDDVLKVNHYATLDGGAASVELRNPSSSTTAEVLLLQGKPIGGKVIHRGPFVTSSMEELQETFIRYQADQFGHKWPWPTSMTVFPREEPWHTQIDGKKSYPPSHNKAS